MITAINLVSYHHLDDLEAARTYARLSTAMADAAIATWDTKFAYWSMRPVTAITRSFDAGWRPVLQTPPFPGYVSGHSAISAAAATVLSDRFPSGSRDLWSAANQAAMSRLYGGIHFRSDIEDGLTLGRRVAAVALMSDGNWIAPRASTPTQILRDQMVAALDARTAVSRWVPPVAVGRIAVAPRANVAKLDLVDRLKLQPIATLELEQTRGRRVVALIPVRVHNRVVVLVRSRYGRYLAYIIDPSRRSIIGRREFGVHESLASVRLTGDRVIFNLTRQSKSSRFVWAIQV